MTTLSLLDYEGKKYIINNPYDGGSLSLKGQLHCHTINSDGIDTPTALVTAYKNAGYDFVTTTDHDFKPDGVTPLTLVTDPGVIGITWIGSSIEETYAGRHICVYDIDTETTEKDAQTVINYHRNNGKMTSIAHPHAAGLYIMDKSEIESYYGYNFMEIFNSIAYDYEVDCALSTGKKLFLLAVDDCHNVNIPSQFNKGWVVVHSDANLKSAILESLRNGNFYASTGNDITITLVGNVITASSVGPSNFVFYGRNGRILKSENSVTNSSYTILGNELYVRVKSFLVSDVVKIAWSQPVFIDSLGTDDENFSRLKRSGNLHGIHRQAIMNSDFKIWQRGTNFINPNDGAFVADRWSVRRDASGGIDPNITWSRFSLPNDNSWDSINGYAVRLTVDGAGSGYGSSSWHAIRQKILGGTRELCGSEKSVTVSFMARSSILNKKIGVFLVQEYGSGGTPSPAEVLNGTNFLLNQYWQKFTHIFKTNNIAWKSFGTDNNDQLTIYLQTQWGSDCKARVGDTVTESFVGAGDIDFKWVQLNEGLEDMPYYSKVFEEELNDCQGYYQLRSTNNINVLDLRPSMVKIPTITGSVSPFAYDTGL